MAPFTVLISGLGVAGPTLAYWLRRFGFVPTVVERAPAPRTGGYMIDFWGVGFDVADRMGLVPALERDGYRLEELRLVDGDGRRITTVDARVFARALDGRFVSLPRGDLAHRIYELIDGGVETIFADSIVRLEQDARGVEVSFERTATRRFDLVVGADGLHSNVRRLVFGDGGEVETYLGYYAAAFSAAGYPHRDEGTYVSYALPGRQIARYALRNGRSAFFFVFAQEKPLAIDHHDTAAQRQILRQRFSGTGWECDEILDVMDSASDLYFDVVSQTRLPDWSRGRVVLVGDAAYCPSLLSGQGCAFGMAGAYLLAESLRRFPGDHARAFAEYQLQFKPFVDRKQQAAARFADWFAPRTPFRLLVRNLATRAMGLPYIGGVIAARSFGDRLQLPDA